MTFISLRRHHTMFTGLVCVHFALCKSGLVGASGEWCVVINDMTTTSNSLQRMLYTKANDKNGNINVIKIFSTNEHNDNTGGAESISHILIKLQSMSLFPNGDLLDHDSLTKYGALILLCELYLQWRSCKHIGIIHCDFKPENIMLNENYPPICYFGCVKIISSIYNKYVSEESKNAD